MAMQRQKMGAFHQTRIVLTSSGVLGNSLSTDNLAFPSFGGVGGPE